MERQWKIDIIFVDSSKGLQLLPPCSPLPRQATVLMNISVTIVPVSVLFQLKLPRYESFSFTRSYAIIFTSLNNDDHYLPLHCLSAGPQGGFSERHQSSRDQRMRVFVALFDYDPANMSPNVDSHHDELAFREGQLIKVCTTDIQHLGTKSSRPCEGHTPSAIKYMSKHGCNGTLTVES